MPARRTPLPAELRTRPFTRREALALGVGADVLRGPGVQSIDRGIYLSAELELTPARRLSGYLQVLPCDTVVDSVTALQLHGIDIGPTTPSLFCTTAAHHPRRTSVRVRRVDRLPPHQGHVSSPVPALVAARTQLGLLDLVAAADWMVRRKLASSAAVRRGLAEVVGRDSLRARRAAELVREKVASPRETRLRLLMVFAGLPEPETNVDLGDERFFLACVDLYLRAWAVVVEYEGDHHRTDPRQYDRDLRRYEALAAAGYVTVRISKEALRRPRDVAERIYRALVSQGYGGPPPTFGPEWCQTFGR